MNTTNKHITFYYQPKRKYWTLKYSILIGLFVYWVICLLPPVAQADGLSLSLSPSLFQIEALPPADIRVPLTIENQNDSTVKLKVVLKFFRSTDYNNGEIEYIGDKEPLPAPDKQILQKVQLVDEDNIARTTFDLGPKQQKKLRLRVNIPKGEAYSDYYFSVIFMSTPLESDLLDINSNSPQENNFSTATGGIAANVLLSIGPKDQPKGFIDIFSAPYYLESGPVPFTLLVRNDGSHFISPRGVILIKNMFGQTVGRVEIPPTNVLSGTSRALRDLLQLTNATESAKLSDLSNQKTPGQTDLGLQPKVIWPETFLLGFYTANLSLAVTDRGPIYSRTLHFFAFPLKILLGLVLAAVIVFVIYLRVRKKLKTE